MYLVGSNSVEVESKMLNYTDKVKQQYYQYFFFQPSLHMMAGQGLSHKSNKQIDRKF